MSNLENKLKKIINKFNGLDKENAYIEIKNLSQKYKKNLKVQNILSQISINMGDIDTAISALKNILFIEGNNSTALNTIYKLLIRKKEFDEALNYINLLLKIDKDNYEAKRDKLYIYFLKENFSKAIKYIQDELVLKIDDYFGINISGLIYLKLNDFNKAKKCFEKSIKINKEYIDAYNNLGTCLIELEKLDKAEEIFTSAYKINRNNLTTLINLGNVNSLRDKVDNAINFYNKALVFDSNNSEVYSNLTILYCRQENEEMAKLYFDKAIKINPNDNKLKYAYSTLNLKLNNFKKSWDFFDSRLLIEKNKQKLKNFNLIKNTLFSDLLIDSKDRILILREQGIGEEVLFSSIYEEIINKFDNIKIEADKRLVPIFKRSFKKEIFVEEGYISNTDKVNEFDKLIYAGSLLKIFRKNINDFKNKNYLLADRDLIKVYEEKLKIHKKKMKVGISWKSVVNIYGNLKSLSIKDFEPLFNKDRLIINLQYGDIKNDKDYILSKKKHLEVFSDLDLFNDIEGCMALLKNLDLFITVSNSTAHFAGALGVPTILICPKKSSTYYYWNTKSERSIWYRNILVLGIKESINQTIANINSIIKKNEFKFSN